MDYDKCNVSTDVRCFLIPCYLFSTIHWFSLPDAVANRPTYQITRDIVSITTPKQLSSESNHNDDHHYYHH
ncbi:MAG: hypothetical protein RLZZ253_588, partial [Verrucomicrobiota bacterium]